MTALLVSRTGQEIIGRDFEQSELQETKIRKELLTVLWCVDQWKDIIAGQPCEIILDHDTWTALWKGQIAWSIHQRIQKMDLQLPGVTYLSAGTRQVYIPIHKERPDERRDEAPPQGFKLKKDGPTYFIRQLKTRPEDFHRPWSNQGPHKASPDGIASSKPVPRPFGGWEGGVSWSGLP